MKILSQVRISWAFWKISTEPIAEERVFQNDGQQTSQFIQLTLILQRFCLLDHFPKVNHTNHTHSLPSIDKMELFSPLKTNQASLCHHNNFSYSRYKARFKFVRTQSEKTFV